MTAPTKASPTNNKEWEEYVHGFDTPEDYMKAFNDGSFKQAMVDYGNASNKVMDDLRAQMEEQGQLATAELLEKNGYKAKNRLDLVDKTRAYGRKTGALHNKLAVGAKLDGKFESMGEFFTAALALEHGKSDAQAKHKDILDLLNYSEQVPSEGGILVPEEYRSDLLSVGLEEAIVRPQAQVVPMKTGKLRYPAVEFTTEVGEVFGGIVSYWMDEGEEIPETSGAFAMLELNAHKLANRATPPNELVRDFAAFTAWIMQNLPKALVHSEDLAFLKGNGVKKPLGQLHLNNPSLLTVSKEVGQSAASITWPNILDMVSRMLPESLGRAEWTITPDALREVMTMALAVGTGGSAVMAVNAALPGPPTLFGQPIRWARKAPAVLGTQGDISLTDYSTYVIGDTQAVTIESSTHEQFSKDKTVFRCISRVDGQPGLLAPLTPENNGPTLSATVQLETRS